MRGECGVDGNDRAGRRLREGGIRDRDRKLGIGDGARDIRSEI